MHCGVTRQHAHEKRGGEGGFANARETHRIADALKEEEQVEAGDAAVARAEGGAEAASHARHAVRAQQKCGVDEA